MAKAKKVKKTEGGDALREGYTSKLSNASISLWESAAPKKKRGKSKRNTGIRSFKPKKPVTGMLEAQGY